ncbi:Uncharacterized protein PBTT_04821 [Plasmodiophora brassicae]|uniref:Uncharacterized protein n=1 Tax=Plasmodiophora brassicae TaxID=37360 RepID=A0A0G4IRF3_PLABS|nr:hypothetical protein PBRA_005838 [Plasmodiophora brassicae]SPQ98268.1 unnamed protein product [Plasmodiophora brassicae]
MWSKITQRLPYFNLAIGSTAFLFQLGVLYPWHQELDTEFYKLRADIDVKLQRYHELKLQKLESLQSLIAHETAKVDANKLGERAPAAEVKPEKGH